MICTIHAPTPLGLKAPAPGTLPGTRKMPDRLEKEGLHADLRAQHAGTVPVPEYNPSKNTEIGVLNPYGIRDFTLDLAQRVEGVLDRGRFPLVLGGDCSIVIGCTLALKQRQPHGLLFIDGHTDLLTPRTSRTGGVAGMSLGIVTGKGPELLTNIAGLRPLVQERHVVQIGCRDRSQLDVNEAGYVTETEIKMIDLEAVRRLGPSGAAEAALARLAEARVPGWIHLDVDVLHDALMPAVDSRQGGGLSYAELLKVMGVFVASGQLVGMDISIYDPDLDPSGELGQALTRAMVTALEPLAGPCSRKFEM